MRLVQDSHCRRGKFESSYCFVLFLFSEEHFLYTDMTENSTKRENVYFCTVVHMYTYSTHTVASKLRLFRLVAKNVCPTFLMF